jgi:hypothetical protein
MRHSRRHRVDVGCIRYTGVLDEGEENLLVWSTTGPNSTSARHAHYDLILPYEMHHCLEIEELLRTVFQWVYKDRIALRGRCTLVSANLHRHSLRLRGRNFLRWCRF